MGLDRGVPVCAVVVVVPTALGLAPARTLQAVPGFSYCPFQLSVFLRHAKIQRPAVCNLFAETVGPDSATAGPNIYCVREFAYLTESVESALSAAQVPNVRPTRLCSGAGLMPETPNRESSPVQARMDLSIRATAATPRCDITGGVRESLLFPERTEIRCAIGTDTRVVGWPVQRSRLTHFPKGVHEVASP